MVGMAEIQALVQGVAMNTAKDILALYRQGQADCEAGIAQQSSDPDYIQGYGDQYALEQGQAWQTEQMEAQHEHLPKTG